MPPGISDQISLDKHSLCQQSKSTKSCTSIQAERPQDLTLLRNLSALPLLLRNITDRPPTPQQMAETLKNEGNALFGNGNMYFTPTCLSDPIQERRDSEILRSHSTRPDSMLVQQSRCRIRQDGRTRCRIRGRAQVSSLA